MHFLTNLALLAGFHQEDFYTCTEGAALMNTAVTVQLIKKKIEFFEQKITLG